MAESREINIRVSARDETGGVFAAVGRKMRDLVGAAPSGPIGAKGIEEALLGGSDRGLKGLIRGGAVGFIGEKLDAFTEKGAEMAEQFRQGEISTSDMAGDLLRATPILGSFVRGWDNIQEAITGDKAELARVTAGAQLLNQTIDQQSDLIEKEKNDWIAVADTIANIKDQIAGIGLEGMKGIQQRITAAENAEERQDVSEKYAKERAAYLDTVKQINAVNARFVKHEINADDAESAMKKLADGYNRSFKATEGQFAQKSAANREKYGAIRNEAIRQANIQSGNIERGYLHEIDQLDSESNQARLRSQGKFADAQIEQVRAGADAQKKEIRKQLYDEQKLLDPARFKELETTAGSMMHAIDEKASLDIIEAARQGQINDAREKAGVDRQAAEAKIDSLRVTAELGGQSAELEEQRAEIAEKYREKREQINQQLREDLALTSKQKETLRSILAGLDDQEKKEKKIAAAKRLDLRLSSANTGRGVSGVLASEFAIAAADMKSKIAGSPAMSPAMAGRAPQGAIAGQFRADWLNSQANSVQWAAAESVYGKGPVSSGSAGVAGSDPASSTAKSTATAADLLNQILTGIKTLVQAAQSSGQPQSIFGS